MESDTGGVDDRWDMARYTWITHRIKWIAKSLWVDEYTLGISELPREVDVVGLALLRGRVRMMAIFFLPLRVISMDAIALGVFASRLDAVCDEMGAVLRDAAFSPNIRDRLDYSCAVFDAQGGLCAQAAHIPVHLGSMAFAMAGVVAGFDWRDGDMVILNDPYLGGTHLPDVTLIAPLVLDGVLRAFVVNRAHHADIGAESPGSMPLSRHLDEEGVLIPPRRIMRKGRVLGVLDELVAGHRDPSASRGDLAAQIAANRAGRARLGELARRMGGDVFTQALGELNAYGERLARAALADLPDGEYSFVDWLEDDGQGHEDLRIQVRVGLSGGEVRVDFSGTAEQVEGNVNCPLSVAAAGVYYVFRCLMPAHTPACAGSFSMIQLSAPAGCLLNAQPPAAVAAGNVETSTRVVDCLIGALAQAVPDRMPAASHGSMNNLAMGRRKAPAWDYYETIGGGMGAHRRGDGLDAVQTHMTNTLNTPVEVLETHYPLRVRRYAIRRGSGGAGFHRGGDGIVREFEFLQDAEISLLTERRRLAPWGAEGGQAGCPGRNCLNGRELPPKTQCELRAGDRLSIETPGGGGWGTPPETTVAGERRC